VSEVTRDRINEEQRLLPATRPLATTPARSRAGRSGSRRRLDGPLPLRIAIGMVVALGLLGLLPGLHPVGAHIGVALWPLVLFAGLTVAAEQCAVDIARCGKTSVAIVAVLAAAFLLGTPGIL